MRLFLGLALASLLALPVASAAADTPAAPVEHTFTDADLVEGTRAGHRGEFIPVRPNAGRNSLIRVRSSFVVELLKDAERL